MKKFDHLTLALDDGRVIQSESGTVSLENPTGKERTAIATTAGNHAFSTKRVVPQIKSTVVLESGQVLTDLDINNARITLRDTETGARLMCAGCYTGTVSAVGGGSTETVIFVTGDIVEL